MDSQLTQRSIHKSRSTFSISRPTFETSALVIRPFTYVSRYLSSVARDRNHLICPFIALSHSSHYPQHRTGLISWSRLGYDIYTGTFQPFRPQPSFLTLKTIIRRVISRSIRTLVWQTNAPTAAYSDNPCTERYPCRTGSCDTTKGSRSCCSG